jgi:stage IV sporulation protein FB
MRNVLSWNVSLGRWADVQVRLHVAFLVLITAVLHLCTGPAAAREYAPALWGLTILFLSVVAHEFGHCVAVWRSGGRIEQVVLGPWGGLTYLHPTRERQTELLIAAAGPAMNLALCAAALVTLAVLRQPVEVVLRPFTLPALAEATTFVQMTALVAWINALIVLVNLLPAFPLDGARALRAVLRPIYGFRTAVVFTARTGFAMVVGLLVAAWLLRHDFDKASLACTLLGMFLYFSDREEVERLHDREASDDDGYEERYDDEEEDEVPPPRRRQGPLRRWIDQRREEQLAKRLEQEREEESLVDEVLMRLHTLGPAALSTSDRALLQRVSARYRERQQG